MAIFHSVKKVSIAFTNFPHLTISPLSLIWIINVIGKRKNIYLILFNAKMIVPTSNFDIKQTPIFEWSMLGKNLRMDNKKKHGDKRFNYVLKMCSPF